MSDALLHIEGLKKRFGGVIALRGVDLEVRRGEVHALVGENGAGKSTLIHCLAGAVSGWSGRIFLEGRPVHFTTPREAYAAGIAVLYQSLRVLPNLTVAENIMLGQEKVHPRLRLLNRRVLRAEAEGTITQLGFDLAPDAKVGALSTAKQCLVEIAAALRRRARLLVLDESTASLGKDDVGRLFAQIHRLKAGGLGILYVSHRLAELPRVADRVTVLRDGAVAATKEISQLSFSELTYLMHGRALGELFPRKRNKPGEVLLSVRNLTCPGKVFGVSFQLRAGEILGLAGLVGAGRSEIARSIYGADPSSGTLLFQGKELPRRSPHRLRPLGVGFVPADRRRDGLLHRQPVSRNLTVGILEQLSGTMGFLPQRRCRLKAQALAAQLRVEPPCPDTPIEHLSGGNQQKVVLGRWIAVAPSIIILDEPTQGVDIATKAHVYRLIMELACEGRGVLFISSEFSELLRLCDRILVLREGRIAAECTPKGLTEDELFALCLGKDSDNRPPEGI